MHEGKNGLMWLVMHFSVDRDANSGRGRLGGIPRRRLMASVDETTHCFEFMLMQMNEWTDGRMKWVKQRNNREERQWKRRKR